jgi:hypothetical protein
MSFDPDKLLTELATRNPMVLFYPSCGEHVGRIFQMEFDVFILSDYLPKDKNSRNTFWKNFKASNSGVILHKSTVNTRVFRIQEKIGFLFFQDNNDVLRRIQDSGNRISCFVGVNDGCGEGGNYECVNESTWLEKVFRMYPEKGGMYITDHSPFLYPMANLYDCPMPKPYLEFILRKWRFKQQYLEERERIDPWESLAYALSSRTYDAFTGNYFSRFPFKPSYSDYLVVYRVTKHKGDSFFLNFDNLKLSIEHDNIVSHIKEIDGAVISSRCWQLCQILENDTARLLNKEIVFQHFFKPSLVHTDSGFSARELLNVASKNSWDIVGTTAFGEGDHISMLKEFSTWDLEFPKHIRIFYLDYEDFGDIKCSH